jgi:hypothetical protein
MLRRIFLALALVLKAGTALAWGPVEPVPCGPDGVQGLSLDLEKLPCKELARQVITIGDQTVTLRAIAHVNTPSDVMGSIAKTFVGGAITSLDAYGKLHPFIIRNVTIFMQDPNWPDLADVRGYVTLGNGQECPVTMQVEEMAGYGTNVVTTYIVLAHERFHCLQQWNCPAQSDSGPGSR